MKKIKIAFFDIDGTLIDMNKKVISEKMIETLKLLKKNNIIICIATGRPPRSVPQFPNIEFDAFLTFNASYCYTKDEVIFSNPIPTKDVLKIIENSKSINRPVSIASASRIGANGRDQDLIDYFAFSKQVVEVVEDFDELTHDKIYQIMMGCYKEEYDMAMKDVEGAKITAWWDRAVDIIPSNGSKGVGVEKILEYFHFTKDEAIAFGDGTNDIEMLQAVGTGVAMGNATDNVKAIADDICGHVADEGIYYYCKEHQLI